MKESDVAKKLVEIIEQARLHVPGKEVRLRVLFGPAGTTDWSDANKQVNAIAFDIPPGRDVRALAANIAHIIAGENKRFRFETLVPDVPPSRRN